MAQIVNDEVSVSNFREVEIEDLLGREPVKTNLDEVMGYIAGKVVLVTGGGGSIGSELCRQIAAHHPSQLVIFDIYENTTYDLQQELRKKFPNLNLVVLIGSVRNTHRVDTVFSDYKPAIVFMQRHISMCHLWRTVRMRQLKTMYSVLIMWLWQQEETEQSAWY